jgi:FkbM family methyltransferase
VAVECFCDTYRSGVHETGLPIISAEQLGREYRDATVVVTSELHGASIRRTLDKMAYPGRVYAFDELSLFFTVPLEDFAPHLDGYAWAYDFYGDAASRAVVLGAMRARLLGSPLAPSANPQYFEPEICPLGEAEIFVDAGCFIGDTAEEFIRRSAGAYRHIYGFEPDADNLKKARANLARYENVELFHGGLWHMDNRYGFMPGAFGGSKLSEEGELLVDTYALDAFFADREPPTFIKMDIEGAEYQALDGAAALLRDRKPKLAICVYHGIPDMYTLPRRILRFNPDYKMALRHYSRWYAESVCYAV